MTTDDGLALIRRLVALPPALQARALAALTEAQRRELIGRWRLWAHPGQLEPEGDWRVWLLRAGRGFGKTRAGAEWVTGFARDHGDARIALVGATVEDVRSVMVEGPSGLIAVAADGERVRWRSRGREVRFASGATAFVYSAAAPETLRGPEHHLAWCDELAKWRYGDAAWDNLMMGMRLGDAPRVLVTTTPRPVPLLRRIMADRATVETLGRTRDNPHLPASFVAAMAETYGGTRLGRQELDGELIDDVAGALWTRDLIERCRVREVPELGRVVVGVDPPAGPSTGSGGSPSTGSGRGPSTGSGQEGDACGIVAIGLGRDGHGYVIEDASVAGATPEGWARAVAVCAARVGADRVVAEANQGGAMVRSVLAAADAGLPVRLVHASRGKAARAEPVATLYEAGKMHHVGAFGRLEDELCGLVAGGGYEGPGRSPDRADALVWAASELMLGRRGVARVRGV